MIQHTINYIEFDVNGKTIRILGSSRKKPVSDVQDCDWPVIE